MFAKHWTPGKVKTRLAATLGDETAAKLQRVFVEHLANRLSFFEAKRQLWFTPMDSRPDWKAPQFAHWSFRSQSSGNLGDRLRHFFSSGFDEGASAVIAIGSDSPWLNQRVLHTAFEYLRQSDAVLGPAVDGGYYLIGLSRDCPSMWDKIRWSHAATREDTIRELSANGHSISMLELGDDVDTIDDLSALRRNLDGSLDDTDRALAAAIAEAIGDPLYVDNEKSRT
jgi:rSAM/selenodomain-associated transferase 1